MTWLTNVRIAPRIIGGCVLVALTPGVAAVAIVTASGVAHRDMTPLILGAVVCAVAVAIAVGFTLARSITGALAEVRAAAENIEHESLMGLGRGLAAVAHGDLTVRVTAAPIPTTYRGHDEIGQTADAVRAIAGRTRTAIADYEAARSLLQRRLDVEAWRDHGAEPLGTGIKRRIEESNRTAGTQSGRPADESARPPGESRSRPRETLLGADRLAALAIEPDAARALDGQPWETSGPEPSRPERRSRENAPPGDGVIPRRRAGDWSPTRKSPPATDKKS